MGIKVRAHKLQTIKEDLDEYVLDDGNTLRTKQVLTSFGITDEIKKIDDTKSLIKIFVNTSQITAIVPTGDVDTSNLEQLPVGVKISKETATEKIGFKEKSGCLNIYETDEFMVFVRNTISDVWKTKYKDANGVPIYYVEGGASVEAKLKKDIAKIKPKPTEPPKENPYK